ncbi:hypothetical protein ACWCSH_14650, partial [Streptosporangium sp. NPDC001682]
MTAACGGSSGNDAICTEAAWTKIFTDYTTSATAGAGDVNKLNDATAKLAADLKALAGTADGDVATALTDLATSRCTPSSARRWTGTRTWEPTRSPTRR